VALNIIQERNLKSKTLNNYFSSW